jgi:hypothetical protein
MTDVLYLVGWGRSGTTIVENILNAYDGIFSAGELHYLWERGFLEGRRCGCGQPLAECPLWAEVLRVAYGARLPDPRQVVALQQRRARIRHTRRLCDRDLDPDSDEYRHLLTQLYTAIAKVTGARLIVDSSKRPPGAAMLTRMQPEITGYLLHMVRDPRAVAYSWNRLVRQPDRADPAAVLRRHGSLGSTVHWLVWNRLAEYVARAYPEGNRRRLRYEDFVDDPYGTIQGVLDFVGYAGSAGPFVDATTVRLDANHTISGNPRRFDTGDVPISRDDAWRQQQAAVPRLVASLASLPLQRRYGYPMWVPGGGEGTHGP